MSLAQPDKDRRLLPRWRSPTDAALAGELFPLGQAPDATRRLIISEQFDQAVQEWRETGSAEAGSEVVESAIVLGREGEIVDVAAELITESGLKPEVKRLARRVLASDDFGKTDSVSTDLNVDVAAIRGAIASLRLQVRRDPRSALAWMEIGRLHTMLGQETPAERSVLSAVAISPSNRFVARAAARFFVHKGDPEQALSVIRRSIRLERDPWLMAAEISLAQIAGATSVLVKRALELSSEDSLHPWHTSELNGALAGLVARDGNIKRARKLMSQSLRFPTENALAQAQWAAGQLQGPGIAPIVAQHEDAFEAQALLSRSERNWIDACNRCRLWSNFEPTSSRPLVLGSFMALTAMNDPVEALAFLNRAVLIEPRDPVPHNNRAVALAYMGRMAEARRSLERAIRATRDAGNNAVLTATAALLMCREGRVTEGIAEYRRAAELSARQKDGPRLALILAHLLRELLPYAPDAVQKVIPVLADKTKAIRLPELEDMRKGIERDAAKRSSSVDRVETTRFDIPDILGMFR